MNLNQFFTVGSQLEQESLSGKMLVATPSLNGSIFEKSLIYVCSHDADGAIGIIINKPLRYLTEEEILEKTNTRRLQFINHKFQIFTGGPIEEKYLYALTASLEQKQSFANKPNLTLYTNAEGFLLDVIKGKNHDSFIVAAGYCGWSTGQLEEEVKENSWILIKPDIKTIFEGNPIKKWEKCIRQAGIRNVQTFKDLVSYSGNA